MLPFGLVALICRAASVGTATGFATASWELVEQSGMVKSVTLTNSLRWGFSKQPFETGKGCDGRFQMWGMKDLRPLWNTFSWLWLKMKLLRELLAITFVGKWHKKIVRHYGTLWSPFSVWRWSRLPESQWWHLHIMDPSRNTRNPQRVGCWVGWKCSLSLFWLRTDRSFGVGLWSFVAEAR